MIDNNVCNMKGMPVVVKIETIIYVVIMMFIMWCAAHIADNCIGVEAATEHDQVIEVLETRNMRVTAYCPYECCCGKWADGVTASGTLAVGPLVAAPPNIPFGTQLIIAGYADGRVVRVWDRGGAIKGNRLDVLFLTHEDAREWGVRYVDVQFVGE
jgi:3D (Asp-Asp-Asp) domain-containing protein